MSEESTQNLIKRFDLAISLILNPLKGNVTDQEKIRRFNQFEFTPLEIANILGSTPTKVSKQLYVIRKKKQK